MEKFSCRGRPRRIQLLETHEITPVSHISLLNGQSKRSAAEDTITKEYYCFLCKEKNSNSKSDTFIVGTFVANDFLKLLKLKPLPLFNVLKNDDENYIKKAEKKNILIEKEKWNELALELYNVTNIIIMVWDRCGGPLAEILLRIKKYYTKEPYDSIIKSINTIISKDREKRTIYDMINWIKERNVIKTYEFPLIKNRLKNIGIENYITGNGT